LTQALKGRRGAVFSVRLTSEERARLSSLMARGGGPRSNGAWLVWSALHRGIESSGSVIPRQPDSAGEVVPGPDSRASSNYPSSGSTSSMGSPIAKRTICGSAYCREHGCDCLSAPRLRSNSPPIAERTILDLCAGSGSWSEPYRDAGYRVVRVTLPETDVRTFEHPDPVWGVLAAPPCDQFSLARNGHPEIPRDIERGLEVVGACLRVVYQTRPCWWALENPTGLLSHYLGTPRDVFEPCDFGDPWTKRTALWGSFTIPRRGPYVEPLGGGPLCSICDPTRRRTSWCNNPAHRAITPPGFARAFFEANP
jgi:hypothetical protein